MRKVDWLCRVVIILGLLAAVAGCSEFWARTPGQNGAATRPSPADRTAAAISAAALLADGTPVSPVLSLAASSLAVLAAAMARSHSKSAKYSACQAGVLLQSFNAQGQKPGEN